MSQRARPAPRMPVLGEDERHYGSFTLERPSERAAYAISVGADRKSPGMAAKGDAEQPNEDALLVFEDEDGAVMAVADGHWGREASHDLLRWLADALGGSPRPVDHVALAAVLDALSARPPAGKYRSRTTLVVAVYDRTARRGFGLSFGDSSLVVAGAGRLTSRASSRNARYVSPADPSSLAAAHAMPFAFTARPGDLILAFTDGIDECHYGQPATSVTPLVMAQLIAETGDDPELYLARLVQTALAGVGGHPGGQDNIAAVAVRA